MANEKHEGRWSISLFTSLVAAGATAAGMTVYGFGQYVADPTLSPFALVVEHGWHVLALWIVIYACVMVAMHRILLRPIQKIYVHLYGIGAGRLRPLELDTSIRELVHIADGINLMVRRMGIGVDGESRLQVQYVADTLRQVAHDRAKHDLELATELVDAAKLLEQSLTGQPAAAQS